MKQPGFAFVFCLLLAAGFPVGLAAQSSAGPDSTSFTFDDTRYSELRQSLVYEGSPPPPPRPRQQPTSRAFSRSPLVRLLLIGLLATGVGLLLWFVFRYYLRQPSRTRTAEATPAALPLAEIEAQLDRIDLTAYLQQAEASQQWQLALRLQFLMLLQALGHAALIRWKRDKTNSDYLRELYGGPHYGEVRELTRKYERAWYGEQPLTADGYARLVVRFTALRRQFNPIAHG